MRRHPDDATVTEALRRLDPAAGTSLTERELQRADAVFARIVATPSDEPVPLEPVRPRRRRWLLAPVALVGAAGVAIPGLLLGGGNAYGSWTPTPEPLTVDAAAQAAATCRAALGAPGREGRVAVAERRGDWTYVLLVSQATEAICLLPNDSVGDASRPDNFFGSYSPSDAAGPPTLAPDRIVEKTSAEGSTDDGWFNWLEGHVGSDVTGVTVHTSSGLEIQASVAGDRFAAWWPGIAQSSRHPEGETWSYAVHLADGSTRRTSCGQSAQQC
ncbi:hypothetical protein [Nocardioides cavernaquae]|uniref:Uncharacterized protein n=1 Tax=Nocardioides cavernaquae TaxID=2321396 RepID=A0A3A5H4Y4_9ACTN|nr:hypothetical protein [Nocardioides cavernaquae]RJS45759.1 hypothetical protein D4739_05650 [Nocardioides cavernaquae]